MPTTPTPKSMQGMVAVGDDRDIAPLGYLTWFSIPDESIGLRKLQKSLAMFGLSPTLAPTDTKAIHTFKRAMREQEGRHRNGTITETDVAQIEETREICVYQITRLERDLEERVIEYPKALRVIFHKETAVIDYEPLDGVPRSEVMPMMSAIQEFYDRNSSRVTGARVRAVVRNYLRNEPNEQLKQEGLSGENLRGKAGGIYFIPAKHADQLKALAAMLNEAYKGKAYLHAVPMADSATEREIVRRHHNANAMEEAREMMTELRGLLADDRERAPRSDVIAHKWAQFQTLRKRLASYKEILKDEEDEMSQDMAILRKQLDRLT